MPRNQIIACPINNNLRFQNIDILDFLPLSTVDYSGGVIISDWYTDNSNKNQALKIDFDTTISQPLLYRYLNTLIHYF